MHAALQASERDKPGAVYFVRHGESTSNERGILAGIIDVKLTRFGEMQVGGASGGGGGRSLKPWILGGVIRGCWGQHSSPTPKESLPTHAHPHAGPPSWRRHCQEGPGV